MEAAWWSSHAHENHGGGNWLHSAVEIQLTPNSPVNRIKEYSTSIICSSRLENIWQIASYLTNEHAHNIPIMDSCFLVVFNVH